MFRVKIRPRHLNFLFQFTMKLAEYFWRGITFYALHFVFCLARHLKLKNVRLKSQYFCSYSNFQCGMYSWVKFFKNFYLSSGLFFISNFTLIISRFRDLNKNEKKFALIKWWLKEDEKSCVNNFCERVWSRPIFLVCKVLYKYWNV